MPRYFVQNCVWLWSGVGGAVRTGRARRECRDIPTDPRGQLLDRWSPLEAFCPPHLHLTFVSRTYSS